MPLQFPTASQTEDEWQRGSMRISKAGEKQPRQYKRAKQEDMKKQKSVKSSRRSQNKQAREQSIADPMDLAVAPVTAKDKANSQWRTIASLARKQVTQHDLVELVGLERWNFQ
jgi:hypothetical protein